MEMKAAKRIGGGIAIQTLLIGVVLFEIFGLIVETRGDFANGILFFLYEQLNPFEIGGFAILFTITYFLGRNAGKEILIDRRSVVRIALKYAVLMIGLFAGCLVSIDAAMNAPKSVWELLTAVLLRFTLLMVVVWIGSVWRIKRFQEVKAAANGSQTI
jgi:hypothetical protein